MEKRVVKETEFLHSQQWSIFVREKLEEIVDDLIGNISDLEPGDPTFGDDRYSPYPIDRDSFHEIPGTSDSRRISFIDGGNHPIISTPSFSIHLIRVYFNLFKGDERLNAEDLPEKLDFYSISVAEGGDRIKYVTRTVPADEKSEGYEPIDGELSFDSWDDTLSTGHHRVDIDRLGNIARKFAEWKIAGLIAEKELDEGDLIVSDGPLKSSVTNESRFAQRAFEKAEKNGVIFSGLAKTSRIYTTTGNTLVGVVKRLGEEELPTEAWYYHPVADIDRQDHPAEMYLVKLHPESDYVFRYEILKQQAMERTRKEIENILSDLSRNSRDPSFPGYPYGLKDADQFARVRKSELESHEGMLKSAFCGRESWSDLKGYLMATDAHSVLDRIQGSI